MKGPNIIRNGVRTLSKVFLSFVLFILIIAFTLFLLSKRNERLVDMANTIKTDTLYTIQRNKVLYTYYHYNSSTGWRTFRIWSAHAKTFEILDDGYYAKDKNHVYYYGKKIDGDPETFVVPGK
ncbi:MAG: DKNYY domain-containing protein [Candidatus Nomurabacteria bacterium]|nr:DKNYY domain-containing protein [Candidatus Nomurabacteria bacterium]